jgi:ubiquitin carboxyl-terminal hydrolase 16
LRDAPKRRIARHIRMTEFPKILAIHLSRSIFNASHSSQKNSAKVAFPEQLPLGGLLQQRKYKLLGVVTHKGSHHSGHYESFRRQNTYPPFSNPSTFQASEVYSRKPSPAPTPRNEPQGHSPQIAVTPASAQGLSVNGSKTYGEHPRLAVRQCMQRRRLRRSPGPCLVGPVSCRGLRRR